MTEGVILGATIVLIIVILGFLYVLMSMLKQMRQLATQFSNQLNTIQTRLDDRMQRLQTRAESLMEETQRLITTAQPAVEQLRTTLAATTPLLVEAHAVTQVAKETASYAKDAVASIKIETESCMAAIRVTTTELTKLTQAEAENLHQLMEETRHRAERQVMRVEQVVMRTTDRIDETAAIVQHGVLRPVGEIVAVLTAVQKFLQVLFAQERKTIDQVYQDEEMFI